MNVWTSGRGGLLAHFLLWRVCHASWDMQLARVRSDETTELNWAGNPARPPPGKISLRVLRDITSGKPACGGEWGPGLATFPAVGRAWPPLALRDLPNKGSDGGILGAWPQEICQSIIFLIGELTSRGGR